MEANLSANLLQNFNTPRTNGPVQSAQPNSDINPSATAANTSQVQQNPELPTTSQIPEVANRTELRTNQANDAERNAGTQQQIETFLADQTGEDVSNFQGIELQTALELQESFRDRPAPEAAESSNRDEQTQSSNSAVQSPEEQISERLQQRLASQISSDPGTQFPQIIDTSA